LGTASMRFDEPLMSLVWAGQLGIDNLRFARDFNTGCLEDCF
jgi:hypothetical protein